MRLQVGSKSTFLTTFLALAALMPLNTSAQKISELNQRRPRPVQAPALPSRASVPADRTEELEAEVVRIDTDLVSTVFTAVDRDRRFVTTLRADDFRIFENGIPQEISLFERETDRPLTLVILVDTSKSQERTLPDEKKAAKAFTRSVVRPDKDRVALVSFTGQPKVEQELTESLSRLNRAVDRLKVELPPDNPNCDQEKLAQEDPLCWTSIWDSVWASINEVLAPTPENSRRAIILLSDGDDTSSTIKRQDAIEAAIKKNVVVYSIGIGDPELYKIEEDSLGKISDRTGGRAFFPRDDNDIHQAFAQIEEELRSQYVVAYSPKNKARDGSRRQVKIEVVNPELRKRKLQLLYRQSYYASKK